MEDLPSRGKLQDFSHLFFVENSHGRISNVGIFRKDTFWLLWVAIVGLKISGGTM